MVRLGRGGGGAWVCKCTLTGSLFRFLELSGPLPPAVSFTPTTRREPASLPARLVQVGHPKPLTVVAERGPLPVLPAGIPGLPAARFTGETAGPVRWLSGLVVLPRRTAEGCSSLFLTAAGRMFAARLTFTGAGGGVTALGGAGAMCSGCGGIFT